jgi:hypothetical protein
MDAHRSPWDGLPDEQLLLRPGTRPLHLLGDGESQKLSAHGINPLQALRPAGVPAAPMKTLARGSATGPDSSLLSVRRRQLLVLNSIEQGTRWARFDGRDRLTWPRLARQVRTFLFGLAASGAFGKGPDLQACEVICDERINDDEDLAAGRVHCLIALPATRPGEWRSFMLTHSREGTALRYVKSRTLPEGTRFTVRDSPWSPRSRDTVQPEATVRRTLAQELFASPSERPLPVSADDAEATAPRRLDPELIARLYGEGVRRTDRL